MPQAPVPLLPAFLFCCILTGLGAAALTAFAGFGFFAIFGAYVLGGLAGALSLVLFLGFGDGVPRDGRTE